MLALQSNVWQDICNTIHWQKNGCYEGFQRLLLCFIIETHQLKGVICQVKCARDLVCFDLQTLELLLNKLLPELIFFLNIHINILGSSHLYLYFSAIKYPVRMVLLITSIKKPESGPQRLPKRINLYENINEL